MASSLLKGVTVKVQPRSGFDKSRKNILTTKVGTITPILSDLVIPNSDVNIKMAISASLPPLASDTFMRASLKVEGFFCPMRLLYGGFESWLTGYEQYTITGVNSASSYRAELPRVVVGSGTSSTLFAPGSLADYLGVHMTDAFTLDATRSFYLNIFPFLCYHRIYDDWYRNTKIQKPVFINTPASTSSSVFNSLYYTLRSLPCSSHSTIKDITLGSSFMDGVLLGELRQRNYGVDYFTSATPNVQQGAPMTVQTDSSGYFSIAALRSANSIQQWEELQNLTGVRIQDYCKANYGAQLSSGLAQRAVYLGSAEYPVYSKGIYSTGGAHGAGQTNNPFDTVATKFGTAYASGSDFILKGHFDEPGYIMIMVTLVPEVNYSTGVSPLMMRFTGTGSLVDLPNPMLQNVGNEPIAVSELDTYNGINPPDPSVAGSVFGYVPRYTWFKTAVNEVHGLLLDGQTLESFVAQRSFGVGTPQINSNFLQIRTSDLDQVTAVTGDLSQYGVWIDSFIQYHVSMPLAQYSVPSLQNPAYEHGVDVHLQNNGSKID